MIDTAMIFIILAVPVGVVVAYVVHRMVHGMEGTGI